MLKRNSCKDSVDAKVQQLQRPQWMLKRNSCKDSVDAKVQQLQRPQWMLKRNSCKDSVDAKVQQLQMTPMLKCNSCKAPEAKLHMQRQFVCCDFCRSLVKIFVLEHVGTNQDLCPESSPLKMRPGTCSEQMET